MAEKALAKKRIWIDPLIDCDCQCSEEENDDIFRLTYEIPGVEKKDIHLKVIKEGLRLVAHKTDVDFINEFSFQCEADIEHVIAGYDNGVLTVDIPTLCPDPFKEATAVKIQ